MLMRRVLFFVNVVLRSGLNPAFSAGEPPVIAAGSELGA